MTSGFLKSLAATGTKGIARPVDRLTDRELQVLDLIGRGRTTRDIAERLKLGIATVRYLPGKNQEKMNFRNAMELQHSLSDGLASASKESYRRLEFGVRRSALSASQVGRCRSATAESKT